MQEKKITYTERGGVIVDQGAEIKKGDFFMDWGYFDELMTYIKKRVKITHTVFPYKIEGIPMIGEVKRLSAEEFKQAIEDIDTCLMDAPVDFLGTGSDSKAAENNENEWYKKWQSAIKVLREYTQPKALITDAKIEKMALQEYPIEVFNLSETEVGDYNETDRRTWIEGFKASQSLKGNGFSEEDLREAMLHASYKTINFEGVISHRDIDEYIQSLTKPTSAVFTDGEFSHFNY